MKRLALAALTAVLLAGCSGTDLPRGDAAFEDAPAPELASHSSAMIVRPPSPTCVCSNIPEAPTGGPTAPIIVNTGTFIEPVTGNPKIFIQPTALSAWITVLATPDQPGWIDVVVFDIRAHTTLGWYRAELNQFGYQIQSALLRDAMIMQNYGDEQGLKFWGSVGQNEKGPPLPNPPGPGIVPQAWNAAYAHALIQRNFINGVYVN